MQKRILPFFLVGLLAMGFLNWSCNKFDTTDIGNGLIPAVDNVSTFADTLTVVTTQGVFNPDTTVVSRTDNQAVGINNDPLFGQTNASIYFQLKPTFYPYYLGNPLDTLFNYGCGLDSVVLCLKYTSVFYGDSSQPLRLEVREVVDANFRDSVNKPNNVTYKPQVSGVVLGSATVNVSRLGDTVHYTNGHDSSINVIRIKLSQTWANQLYFRDTFYSHTTNNAFYTDSLFRRFYNGLAVQATSGNQLVYVNLSDPATRIEIHFRRRNNGFPVDTIYNSLKLNADYYGTPTFRSSNTANYISRSRPGLPSGDQELYLQTAPGTYANLSIPALTGLSNRIVHRAELIVQQIPDLSGFADIFRSPSYLYLDLKDSGTNKWKPIYHDLNPTLTYDPDYQNPALIPYFPASVDFLYFGGFRRNNVDRFGNQVNYYNFNITKYVQDIATNQKKNYPMRLFAPFRIIYPQYSLLAYGYNNNVAYGRVKVGGGNNPNYKMMLRIIYSKL